MIYHSSPDVSHLAQTGESPPVTLYSQGAWTEAKSVIGKLSTTLVGTVEKIIPSSDTSEPEKAQIAFDDADGLHRAIRIPNTLTEGKHGDEVRFKEGAEVKIIVEAGR
jgi:hypothetical protein